MFIYSLPVSSSLCFTACISVFLLALFFELFVLLLCLCMHTLASSVSLSDMHFYFMRYASSVCFSCCTQPAFSSMNNSLLKQPSPLYFMHINHTQSFSDHPCNPIVFFGSYTEFVHHHRLILTLFFFSGGATLHLLCHSQDLFSLLQL
jgi:hypothetical protein